MTKFNTLPRAGLRRHTMTFLLALVLGIIVGAFCHNFDPKIAKIIMDIGQTVVNIFLRCIKMIIAPLVFSTLICGIAGAGNGQNLVGIAWKAMVWFILASLVSLSLGLTMANLLHPGRHFVGSLPDVKQEIGIKSSNFNFYGFMENIFPDSVLASMAQNNILQIVVFSILFGVAMLYVSRQYVGPILNAMDSIAKITLTMTDIIMKTVPVVIFTSMVVAVTHNGVGIVEKYGVFIVEYYFSIGILWALMIVAAFFMLGNAVLRLLQLMIEPILVGFATASSEAVYPRIMERLDEFGIPRQVSAFVVPLGYSFNLVGSMISQAFMAIFIAQAYGVHMSLKQQIIMLLIMMIASKGIAGVPRASFAMLVYILPEFGIPVAGILLIIGIDQFLDMARTATNVVGNAIAAAICAKWEISTTGGS